MFRYWIEVAGRDEDEMIEHHSNAEALRHVVGRLLDHTDPTRDLAPIERALREGVVPSASSPVYLFSEIDDPAGFWFRLAVLASGDVVSFHNDPDWRLYVED